jgi:hypothetical protein
MALPLTGQIGIKAIAQELGNAIGTSGYSTTSLTNSLYGTAGLTLGQNSSVDDGFLTINTPFTVYFNGTGYNTVYVGSNSYMTFGGGSNAYFSLSNTNPPLPAIMISAADNSYQRVYYGSINSGTTFVVRYEGTASTSGTVGSPNIVWEIHFNNSNQNIDIHIGINNRGASGIGGLKTSNAWIIQPTQLTSANNSIRATLSTGITNVSLRGLEIGSYGAINQNSTYKPNGLSPYKISEWRGYDQQQGAITTTTTTPPSGELIGLNVTTNNFLKSSSSITWVSNLTQNSSYSIVGWCKYNTNPPGPYYLFHIRNTNSNQFNTNNNIWIRYNGFTTLQFAQSGATTGFTSVAAPFPVINRLWHVAVTYNGSSKLATIYFNGVQSNSATFSGITQSTVEKNLAIGGLAGSDNTNNSANQNIDNVGFYNRVLTASEITTIYNNRNDYNLSNISNLQDSWTFSNSNGNSTNGTANLSNIGTPTYSTVSYGAYP